MKIKRLSFKELIDKYGVIYFDKNGDIIELIDEMKEENNEKNGRCYRIN